MPLPTIKKSRIAQIPSIPLLKSLSSEDQRELQRWMLAVTENIQLRDRANNRGGLRDKYLSIDDLTKLGYGIDTFDTNNVPYSFENNLTPVKRWTDIFPTGVSVGVGGTAPIYTAYNGNLYAYEFTGGVSNKEIMMAFQLPHSWYYGGIIKPHLHLYVPNDGSGGTVKFNCEYTLVDVNGIEPSTTTITNTITIAASAGNLGNQVLGFPEVNAATYGLSCIFSVLFTRDQATDTLASSVWLKSADLHAEIDKFGSIQEYTNKR